ncbi:hypothetical protein [Nostoc sp.]|uniref:hypothetical protein n=1 Tax=Nostoc sp. TaxID=1180 RepID=UPI002FF4FD13
MFQKRPLTSASEKEIKQAAVNYTLAHSSQFNILSGTPETIFARPIKAAEIPSTGMGEINFMGEEPPLMLVVVRGQVRHPGLEAPCLKPTSIDRFVT